MCRLLRILLMVCALAASHTGALAQTVIGTVYTLPANAVLSALPWRDSVYVLRNFQDGSVILPNGAPGPMRKLNYNAYMSTLQTITGKDTVNLNDFQGFNLITIGSHLFYNDPSKGFLELMGKGPTFLAVKTAFKGVIATSSGQTFRWSDQRETTNRMDRLYTRNEWYYFMDPDKSPNAAVRINLRKVFPKSKDALNVYADAHKIDFKRRRDLLKLLDYANNLESTTVEDTLFLRVRSGASPFTTSWRDSIYLYPEFQEGQVTFSNGASPKRFDKINYNQLTRNINYINAKGDTIGEDSPENIKTVVIGDNQLRRYTYPGFVGIILQGPLSLMESSKLELVKKHTIVDVPSPSYANISMGTDRHQYLFYKKKTVYFFVDRHQHFIEASPATIAQLYPRDADKIIAFIKEHHTSFRSKKDLIALTSFINTSSISL